MLGVRVVARVGSQATTMVAGKGSGFWVCCLQFGGWCLGFKLWSLRFRVQSLRFRV